jgi:hypothetical protein
MEKWWHWRCDLEPWSGCAEQCLDREQHLNDPFILCFLKTPPEQSKPWPRLITSVCQTYFSDGEMTNITVLYRGYGLPYLKFADFLDAWLRQFLQPWVIAPRRPWRKPGASNEVLEAGGT